MLEEIIKFATGIIGNGVRSGLNEEQVKNNLDKYIEYLKTQKRQEVAEKIKHARGFGDLSENSEYDEAKDEQAKVEMRIVEIEKKGKNHMPASILAELYREIGMFGKCFEFDATSADSKDEMELITEIQYRAARGDKRLFIIEHSEYFQENLRLRKRTPCPLSE